MVADAALVDSQKKDSRKEGEVRMRGNVFWSVIVDYFAIVPGGVYYRGRGVFVKICGKCRSFWVWTRCEIWYWGSVRDEWRTTREYKNLSLSSNTTYFCFIIHS